ncbi:hypothetical protein Tco_0777878 [Tanacetum coccineum]
MRQVVYGEIFCSFFITDNDNQISLEQQIHRNLGLASLLSKQVLGANGPYTLCFRQGQDWPEFLESIHYGKTAPTAKSLAITHDSKGQVQSGATRIEPGVTAAACDTILRYCHDRCAIGGWIKFVNNDHPRNTQLCSTLLLQERELDVWFSSYRRINALTITFSSAISDETAGVRRARTHFETMALLRGLTNFGLALR